MQLCPKLDIEGKVILDLEVDDIDSGVGERTTSPIIGNTTPEANVNE